MNGIGFSTNWGRPLAALFLVANLNCPDTFFAVSRPVGAGKTVTCGTDKSVPYRVPCKTQQRRCEMKNWYKII